MNNTSNNEIINSIKELSKERSDEALDKIDVLLKEMERRTKERFEAIGRR